MQVATEIMDKEETKKEETKKEENKETTKSKSTSETLTDEELLLKETESIPKKLEDTKRVLEERVGLNKSFDVIFREMEFGSKKTGLFYLNGFAKDAALIEVLKRLTYVKRADLVPNTLKSFLQEFIPHIQVEQVDKMSDVVDKVLAGGSALFIEQETSAIVIDAKSFPARGIDEPSVEKVVRGAKDGFIETLLTNVTLVRRRIRDPRLKLEMMKVGKRTQTDVCIAYINDIADLDLVEAIRDKIKQVKVDGIPLGDKQLEENLVGKGWNPYPLVRYSERPDTVATHLLEGHVVVFVDTSPSVMILPTTFFHHVQHAEEYRQTPFIGTYLRWVRFAGIFASLFMLPLWFLFVTQPELKPEPLDFIGPKETGKLPILLQFFLVEIGVDLLRLASVHTPSPLATAMGLISAILIGDIAVKTGLFVNEVILYMAVAAIGMFATPSYELGLANRIVRLVLLVSVALFKIPGLVVGTTLILLMLVMQRSYNSPYMWPFIPFDARALLSITIRQPSTTSKKRPSITKPLDNTRRPT
jgi:stage V sporulation protein AF